jgi:hypothetical protein
MNRLPNASSPGAVLRFSACGARVNLVVEDPTLLELLESLFPDYRTEHASAAGAVVSLTAADAGHVVVDHEGVHHECQGVIEIFTACEFAITQAFLSSCDGFALIHASGAVIGERAVLALGAAGAGKSSLAVCWHLAGHAALGDDVVLVDVKGHAHALRRLYKLDATMLEALGVDPAGTNMWQPDSAEAWYDPGAGAGWAEPTAVGVVAVVRFQQGADLDIRQLSTAEALNALVHSQMLLVPDRAAYLDALASVAEGAKAYDVTFGSVAAAAAAIAERLA